MGKINFIVPVLGAAIALSGCGKGTPPAAQAPATQGASIMSPPVLPAHVDKAPEPVAVKLIVDKRFTVTPNRFRACEADNGAIETDAHWDFSGTPTQEVAIFVTNTGSKPKLWIGGGAQGNARTGRWVYDGTLFTLIDSDTQSPLAQVRIEATPCQ